MKGERAYWCFRGKFYARAVFPRGKVRSGFFFPRGEDLYWYTFSGGDSIPGRFFRGEVLCGGKLYATTPGLSVFRKWVDMAYAEVFLLVTLTSLVSVDLMGTKNQVILECLLRYTTLLTLKGQFLWHCFTKRGIVTMHTCIHVIQ